MFGQLPTACGSELGGWTGVLDTFLTSRFPFSLYRTAHEFGLRSEAVCRLCGWSRVRLA